MDNRKSFIALLVVGSLLFLVPLVLRIVSSGEAPIEPHTAEYFPVQDTETGKWGFIDPAGKPLTPMVFDWAGDFRQGRGLAESDGAMGYIDARFEESGEWAISPRFELKDPGDQPAFGFYDGLARARDDTGKWGYIDATGAWAIKPRFIESEAYAGTPVGDFSEGLAWYQTVSMADRMKVNDDDEIVRDEAGKPVRESYRRRLMGYIDRAGEVVIEPRFEMVQDFGEGLAGARFTTNDLWGFIDRSGKRVLSPEFEGVGRFSEGLCAARHEGLWGYIDKEGEWVIEPTYAEARAFLEGLAPARESERWGYVDKQGDWVIYPAYDNFEAYNHPGDARPFENGLARVTLDGKAIYINKSGEQVWPTDAD